MGVRRELAKRAEVCVLPNEERVKLFKQQTGTSRPVECVWNVPDKSEISNSKRNIQSKKTLRIFYGGTITPKILPRLLIEEVAKKKHVEMAICGYATYSERKYAKWIAKIIKTKKNIELFGAVSRYKMLKIADTCDAAICLYTSRGKNINFKNMVGAANKPFDAMARGLAVVVSDLEEWKRLYLPGKKLERGNGYWISDMGYGIAINPESRESIRAPYRDWETDRKSTRLNSSH